MGVHIKDVAVHSSGERWLSLVGSVRELWKAPLDSGFIQRTSQVTAGLRGKPHCARAQDASRIDPRGRRLSSASLLRRFVRFSPVASGGRRAPLQERR